MFVVSPGVRTNNPEDITQFTVSWPVIWEDPFRGVSSGPVGAWDTRDEAQARADALNAVLDPPKKARKNGS